MPNSKASFRDPEVQRQRGIRSGEVRRARAEARRRAMEAARAAELAKLDPPKAPPPDVGAWLDEIRGVTHPPRYPRIPGSLDAAPDVPRPVSYPAFQAKADVFISRDRSGNVEIFKPAEPGKKKQGLQGWEALMNWGNQEYAKGGFRE